MSDELKIEPEVIDLEPCEDKCEDCDCEPEVEVKPEPEKVKPAAVKKQSTYTAVDGDTYAMIAATFKPAGMTKHAYALHLAETNGPLRPGTEVKL
jgi:hypothetical protein